LAKLSQRIELFHDFVELVFALAHHTRRSFLEWLLGWNAIEPALLGEFFVAGKVEPDEQIYLAIGERSFFGSLGFLRLVFYLALRLWFFGFRRLSGLLAFVWLGVRLVLGAFELVLQLFVEAEGLLPALEFVAGQLGFLFVRAEIKE